MSSPEPLDLMQEIVSLCKQRGFVFPSSEIYGGLKSCYDYGPMGVELKRNIMNEWWAGMVYQREDVVGLDASIIMSPRVWEASGHLAGFSDPLVDCRNCKERFRADHAPKVEPGTALRYREGGRSKGKPIEGTVGQQGYVCPVCGGSDLSEERQFNLMFRTSLGSVDPLDEVAQAVAGKTLTRAEARALIDEKVRQSAVYLRPETAQAMFVQFASVQQALSLKLPFGIAQMGKSFRNEVTVEHFIYRSCEFEQMELEYFVEPGTQGRWLEYWKEQRLDWYLRYANDPTKFRLRQHEPAERAHYADDCYDIEYEYPWGWGELEGIASRTDYDLKKHAEHSGCKLTYFDPETKRHVTPYVIEPAAGATRATLMFLLDAFAYDSPRPDAKGESRVRRVLKLHPRLAPYKVAVLPLVRKEGMPELAREIVAEFFAQGIHASYDEQKTIGKRYARHDEIGTPYCLTVDGQSLADRTVTIRDRDTTDQERIPLDEALEVVRRRLLS